jgi:hypothetical protein
MKALEARALFFQRKLAIVPLTDSLLGLEQLDGQLSVMELTAAAASRADKLAKTSDGIADEALQLGATVALSLVMSDTKERVFSDADIEGVAAFGMTVLKPISMKIKEVSGLLTPAEVETAKKNSSQTHGSDSRTSSPANLVAV